MDSEKKRFIPLIRPSMPPMEEYIEAMRNIWDSHILTNMAQNHQLLEKELCKCLKVDNLRLFVNGHLALECALQAMELKGEVITTPFTFASTTHAIVRCGMKPVFGDIRESDYTLDPDRIEALITDRTCAIVPVHVYGMACDVDRIQQIADKHGLKVIYDAAHAFGVDVNGKGIGAYGDASMFSFHATKVFNTIEGGGLAYKDQALAEKLMYYMNFGITGQETVGYVGGNAKMDEFRAAMGLCNLRHVDEEHSIRKAAAERYDERLSGVKGIKLLPDQQGVTKNYAYYAVVFDGYKKNRDQIFEELRAENILTRKYFYPLCNDFDCYRAEYGNADVPVARHMAKNVLCLPMHTGLTVEDVDAVCDAILK